MSFFEDGDEPPTRAQQRPRPRRTAAPRAGGSGRPPRSGTTRTGGRPPSRPADDELLVRRLVAGGILLVFLFVAFFGLRSCANGRRDRALKDYNRNVAQIATDSTKEVSEPFFRLLNQGQGADLEARIQRLRVDAESLSKQAKGLDVPDQMVRAQAAFELVLDLRTTALGRIASLSSDAASDNGQTAEDAVSQIAGQMQQFLASDVIYTQRVQPYIRDALDDANITGQQIVPSRSMPDLGWLQTNQVAEVLGAKRAGGGKGASSQPAPGLHGHGLLAVSVGSTTLGSGTNRLSASGNVTFTVKLANQGDNNEENVTVKVTVRPQGGKAIVAQRRINQTTAKQESTVNIALGQSVPAGTIAEIVVQINKVPGEVNTDNNKQTFTALFSR